MPNNIFLTGKIDAGKSFIIAKLLKKYDLNAGGFTVEREGVEHKWSRFYFLPINNFLSNKMEQINKIKSKSTFAVIDEDFNCQINNEVFDNYGVKLLSNVEKKDIIVMDELGRFELEAYKFQKKVFEILKSKIPVIGVIKMENNEFLNQVRNIIETSPIIVKKTERKAAYKKVKVRLRKVLEV